MEKLNYKYKVGDVAHFINDYGIVFKDRIITGFDSDYDEPRYFIKNMEPLSFSVKERNLHKELPITQPLQLQNGDKAEFIGCNFWGDRIYQVKNIKCALVDGKLLNVGNDEDEPGFPIQDQFQPIEKEKTCPAVQ